MPLTRFMNAPRRVFAGFAIYSFALGNIFPRMADIQAQMGVEEGVLGLGLIGSPVGTFFALTFLPPLIERLGNRATLLAGVPLLALLYAVAVHAPSPLWLFLLLVPVGLVVGCIEIVLNLEADRVEHAEGRRIMNRAHAFWSIGFFGAGLFGGLIGTTGLSPQAHLACVVPLVLAAVWLFLADFHAARPRSGQVGAAPRFVAPTGPILLLVAVTLSAMLLEGGSIDWSAIYMRTAFDSGALMQGLALAAMAGSQGATRYVADRFVERHSPAGVARVLGIILGLGCLTVVVSPLPAVSLLGFALIGAGSSVMFPLAMSAAAQRTDRPAAINVAAMAQFSFITFLLAPPLLGFIAEHWGIRAAFGLGLPLVALTLLTVPALGRR